MKIPNHSELQRELLGTTDLKDLIMEQSNFTSENLVITLRPEKRLIDFNDLCRMCEHNPGTVLGLIKLQHERGLNYCKIRTVSFTFEVVNK